MPVQTQNAPASALFTSVRASRDLSLVAFGAAVLTAFALTAGAFLPRLSPAEKASPPPAVEPARPVPAPAPVAAVPAATCSVNCG